MITYMTLTYPDKATALQVAAGLSGNPDVEDFPPDGWLGGIYYTIAEIPGGVLAGADYADPVSGQMVAVGDVVPGFHLLGSYRAEFQGVPAPVRLAHVARPEWWPKMG